MAQVADTQTVATVKAAAAAQVISPSVIQEQVVAAAEEKLAAQDTSLPFLNVGPLAPPPGPGEAAVPADAVEEAAAVVQAPLPAQTGVEAFLTRHQAKIQLGGAFLAAGLVGLLVGRALARR